MSLSHAVAWVGCWKLHWSVYLHLVFVYDECTLLHNGDRVVYDDHVYPACVSESIEGRLFVCVCFCVCMFVCLFVLACLHMSQCAYIGFWHRVLFIAVVPLNCVHVNWWVNSCVCVCVCVWYTCVWTWEVTYMSALCCLECGSHESGMAPWLNEAPYM